MLELCDAVNCAITIKYGSNAMPFIRPSVVTKHCRTSIWCHLNGLISSAVHSSNPKCFVQLDVSFTSRATGSQEVIQILHYIKVDSSRMKKTHIVNKLAKDLKILDLSVMVTLN